jgi:hypothetical protein
VWGIVLGTAWGIVWGIVEGIVSATRRSNPHRFFTFQNFEGIILYVKNESDYTRGIVRGIVRGLVLGIV